MLTDAGPLVSLLDRREPDHLRCTAVLPSIRLPLVTTWPVFTEAMHLLGRGGWQTQLLLWQLLRRGDIQLHDIDAAGTERAFALMEQYRDAPMDLADATLIVLAEQLRLRRIFTLDAHFLAYRTHGRQQLAVLP